MQTIRHILLVTLVCALFSARAQEVFVWGNPATNGELTIPSSATNVIAISGGDYHCLALRQDGTVVAWGDNNWGQTNVPANLSNVVAIAANGSHSEALRSDGSVVYWGRSYYSYSDTNVPPNATNLVALASGSGAEHSAAIRAEGTIAYWGDDYFGMTNIPPQARNAVSVAVGEYSVIVLRADGRLVDWGAEQAFYPPAPAIPVNATNIVAVAAGYTYYAALRADGKVITFGSSSAFFPSNVTNGIDVTCPFSANGGHYPVLLRGDGSIFQTGPNSDFLKNPTNQLVAIAGGSEVGMVLAGSGPPAFQTLPVNRTVGSGQNAYFRLPASGAMPLLYQWNCDGTNIPGATNAIFAATNVQPNQIGSAYTLTISNSLGSITSGPMILNEVPFELYTQSSASASVVGATVTLSANPIGSGPFAYTWFLNGTNIPAGTNSTYTITSAQLADGGNYTVIINNPYGIFSNTIPLAITPTIIKALPQSQGIFPGGSATFSLTLQADVPVAYQWQFDGTNLVGETNSELTITNAQSSSAGTYSIIYTDSYEAVTNSATLSLVNVATWGDQPQSTVPVTLTNAIAIAAGIWHELALRADGTVAAWGINYLGVTNVPAGLSNVVAIAAGNYLSVALQSNGTVVAWGVDTYGDSEIPSGLSNVVSIAAGDYHVLALKSDCTVTAWGYDTNGQIDVPPGLTNVVGISAGFSNSVALLADGGLVGWGAGVTLPSLPPLTQATTEQSEGVGLVGDGSIVYWGRNFSGEQNTLASATNVVAIGDSGNETVVLRADGTVVAWGYNGYNEAEVPLGLTNVIAISQCDGFHVMALVGNGPPTNSAEIQSVSKTSQGVAISIPSRPNHVYRLEFTDSLDAPVWNPFPLVAGTGRFIQLTDPTPGSAERFYRVRRW